MKNNSCPNCHEDGINRSVWVYAGWPRVIKCKICNAGLRCRTTGFVANFAQVLVGILIVLGYTTGNSFIYLVCLVVGVVLLYFLPYFGEYEVAN